MKHDLMQEIVSALSALGLNATASDKTDLVVDAELVDAALSTGNVKLKYETMILLDEDAKIAKMYEKTTEVRAGFSFNMSRESYVQSGSTLMRKVTSVQYDPSGKAMEYQFDLGAVSKAIKSAARAQGWRFQTVILKKNAMYR